ncbi:MAG: hypothetical protein FLDDKLPJ_02409 [Phycisphaerae bacterium]|nr:hypothetical protein [Phycisphaerae bacterium]
MNAGRPITVLLNAAAAGNSQAAAELLPLMYDELKTLARSRLGRLPAGNTLQPTALVHEVYLRLVGPSDPGWENRAHFFAAAARSMRQILVDQYRRKSSRKRGGDRLRLDADDVEPVIEPPVENMLALDEALKELEATDARKAQIVNLRYFAGLSEEETAAMLGVSTRTIEREWRFIKRWLFVRLSDVAVEE